MQSFRIYLTAALTSCMLHILAMPGVAFAQPQIIQLTSSSDIIVTSEEEKEAPIQVNSVSASDETERPEIIGDYKAGKWNGNTYINRWADYQITLPENCQKESIASSSLRSHYDFLALIPKVGVNLRISYDDLKDKTLDLATTEEEFGEFLMQEQGFDSEISDFETVTYGGREYTHFTITHQDQLIQSFYLRRVSHYMMVISFTHALVSELHAEDILDTLTYADDLS